MIQTPNNTIKCFSENPIEPVEIYVDNLNGEFFDAAKCTKVMIHGFGSSGNTSWIIDMKDGNVRQKQVKE
jgi:hypothetical protein